jgi:hypothetical protein
MKKIFTYIVIITVSVVVGIGIGMFNLKRRLLKGDNIQSDTTTVTIYDTLKVRIPEQVASRSVGIEIYPIAKVPVLLYHSDTITKPYYVNNELIIPISQRYYKDNRFEAWVSGYNPKLDSVNIFIPTSIQTITNTVEKSYRNEFYVNADFRYYHFTPDPVLAIGVTLEYIRSGRYKIVAGAGLASFGPEVKLYGMVGLSYCLYSYRF